MLRQWPLLHFPDNAAIYLPESEYSMSRWAECTGKNLLDANRLTDFLKILYELHRQSAIIFLEEQENPAHSSDNPAGFYTRYIHDSIPNGQ